MLWASARMAAVSLIRIMLRTLLEMACTSSLMALPTTMRGMRALATSPNSPVMVDTCTQTTATMARIIRPKTPKPSSNRVEIRKSSMRMVSSSWR
jgi:hypothetical protein